MKTKVKDMTSEEWFEEAEVLWNRAIRDFKAGEYVAGEYKASMAIHHYRMAARSATVKEAKKNRPNGGHDD